MKKTKIDWCDATINPVIGCANGCKWCYANIMNTRFGWIPDFCKPQFFPGKLYQLYSKKPKVIFMDSMSDIAYWQTEWKKETFRAINDNSQHRYLFLTKRPSVYAKDYNKKPNLFFGVSVVTNIGFIGLPSLVEFLSLEPLLEPLTLPHKGIDNIKQIIIGAETGNRTDKVIPQKEWVTNLVAQADERGISVFMKGSLKKLMAADFRQDKLIWALDKNVTIKTEIAVDCKKGSI